MNISINNNFNNINIISIYMNMHLMRIEEKNTEQSIEKDLAEEHS